MRAGFFSRQTRPTPHAPPLPLSHTHTATGAAAGVRLTPAASATLFLASPGGGTTDLAAAPAPPTHTATAAAHAQQHLFGTAVVHWLSWEACCSSPGGGGRLAYGRGAAGPHPATVLALATLPPGAAPLARSPGVLARLTVRVAMEKGCGAASTAPSILLASPWAARQAGRGGATAVLTLSPHPLSAAPPSPLASVGPAAAPSLSSLADPAAPTPAPLLPRTCRAVVECLAGVTLPPPLAAAIGHSLASPAGILRTALDAKVARGAPPYLRVGVSPRCGALAPGEPFVLEIWPAGSASPIHGHGGCCGGFVVLHGACVLRTYNSLDGGGGGPSSSSPPSSSRAPLFEGLCGPGAVGWFDQSRHQVHSISAAVDGAAAPGAFCATLQAFRYAEEDDVASPFMEIETGEGVAWGCGALGARGAHGPPTVSDVAPVSDFQFASLAPALLAEHAGGSAGGSCGGGGGPGAAVVEVTARAAAGGGADEEEEAGEADAARFVWVI